MVKTEYMHMAIVLVCIHVDSKQYNEQSNGQCRHRLFDLGLNWKTFHEWKGTWQNNIFLMWYLQMSISFWLSNAYNAM